MQYVEPAKQFAKDSIRLVKRCTKPDRKGMVKLCHTCEMSTQWQDSQKNWKVGITWQNWQEQYGEPMQIHCTSLL